MDAEKVLAQIKRMEYDDLMQVLRATIRRWRVMFPDWDIFSVSVPKDDPEALQRSTDMILRLMEERKTGSVTHVAPDGEPDSTAFHKNVIRFQPSSEKKQHFGRP